MTTVPTSLHFHTPIYPGPYGGGRGPVIYPGEPLVDTSIIGPLVSEYHRTHHPHHHSTPSSIPIYVPPSGTSPIERSHPEPIDSLPHGIRPMERFGHPAPLPPHLRHTSSFSLYPSPTLTPSIDPVLADPPNPYFSPVNEPSPSHVASPSPIAPSLPLPVIAQLAYRISVHRPGEHHHYLNATNTNGTTNNNQTNSSASSSTGGKKAKPTAYLSTAAAAAADDEAVRSAASMGSKVGKGLMFFAVIGSLVVGMMGL
ncbi:MAG: hypothetical protein LQ350_005162 [Teloschistes chrysophthalmus]|nr:MAG: hypothetical protein LQ350_005162 [Niorma chrysophthalma]